MTKWNCYLLMAVGVVAMLMIQMTPTFADGPRYWIDESTDFTGNGCENADLNNVTSSLKSRLDADGWAGTRWSNSNAWPEDFIEQDLGGIDHVAGDDETLSVYAGHGNRALIQFGFMRSGRCTVSFPSDTRLGTQGGDDAVYAMWVTSCTVHLDSLSRHFDQAIRQTFGYHNSPSVKDNQPRDFYEETNDLRNERAWIEEMEDRPGWFTGDNSPIALTFGLSSSHCAWVRDTAKLRDEVLLYDAPAPDAWYCYLMFNNGDSGC
ncbi:MAG: DUF6345 domain-containing protein, partial [Thermodesulfobacteriota bacterium]